MKGFQIRFDGPPGPQSGRFVEVETNEGASVKLGEWKPEGEYWLLRFKSTFEGFDASTIQTAIAWLEDAANEATSEDPAAGIFSDDKLAKLFQRIASELREEVIE